MVDIQIRGPTIMSIGPRWNARVQGYMLLNFRYLPTSVTYLTLTTHVSLKGETRIAIASQLLQRKEQSDHLLKFAALRSPINPPRRAETNTNAMASLSSHAPKGYDTLGYRMWESFQQVQDLNIESMLF